MNRILLGLFAAVLASLGFVSNAFAWVRYGYGYGYHPVVVYHQPYYGYYGYGYTPIGAIVFIVIVAAVIAIAVSRR